MKFDMKPQDKAFLELAERVAAGEGNDRDRVKLESMMKENPELEDDFRELERNLRDEVAAEFWSVAVRVMVGTANPQEVRQIESLKTTDRRRWEKYQDAVFFIEAMASRQDALKDAKIEPMPQNVRQKLLSQLSLDKPNAT